MAMARTSMRPAGITLIHWSSIFSRPPFSISRRSASPAASTFEVDQVGDLDGFDGQLEMAHQRLDDRPTQQVVRGQLDAAQHRQAAGVEDVVVLVERLDVLA